jgi:hypothetical protein
MNDMTKIIHRIKFLRIHSHIFYESNKKSIASLLCYWYELVENLYDYLKTFDKENILAIDKSVFSTKNEFDLILRIF